MRDEKRFLQVFAIGLAALVVGGGFWTSWSVRQITAQVREDLSFGVEITGAGVNAARVEQLTLSPADKTAEDYLRLRAFLGRVQKMLDRKHVRGVYLMKVTGDDVRFVVDSAPETDPWHSEPGKKYEEPPAAVFETARLGETRFVGPYTDEYGTFYSVFSPVRDVTGRIVAVAGGDVDAAMYDLLVNRRLRLLLAIALLAMVAYCALGFAVVSVLRRRHERTRRLAEQLRGARERDALLMNINEGVVAVDESGIVTFVNTYAAKAVGTRREDAIGKPFEQRWLVTDEKGVELPEERQPLMAGRGGKTKAPSGGYVYLRGKNGTFPVIVASARVRGKDFPAMTVMTFRDYAKEAEVDRMKSDFISVAAHQIKTPLTALKWIVGTLTGAKTVRPPEEAEVIGQLSDVVRHLDELVHALLNVSRIESGKLVLEPRPVALAPIVEDAMKEVELKAKEKNLHLSLVVGDDVAEAMADSRIIREVYKNLLTNAVKYTSKGGHVHVEIAGDGESVRSSVKDDGYGIPDAEKDRVFAKFFRASNVVGLDEEGTGLGLYYAKQVVEASGGEMWFESTQGKGSTFYFRLPVAELRPKKHATRAR